MLATLWASAGWAQPFRLAFPAPTSTADCDDYCDEMARACPDVFLGNRATCQAACALFPDDTDRASLGCRLPGQQEAVARPQPEIGPTAAERAAASEKAETVREQLRADTTVVPEGLGALFVPSLGLGIRSPVISVWTDNQLIAEGRPGRRILVPPGSHLIRFGNAPERLQIRTEVEVEAGQTAVVDVPWAAIQIDVVDPQFVPFRGTYELIELRSREVVGLGFGADALLGERLKVWVVRPGIYKIVQPGGTYRDRVNFATVRLLPDEYLRYVLVQNPDTGEFRGAGLSTTPTGNETWMLRGLLGGDFIFLRSELASIERGWSVALNLFFDVTIRMSLDAHRWLTRLELEQGQTRPPGADRFRSLRDRLFINTIYSYALLQWFGPYVRVGLETKVLPRTDEFDSPREVLDENGDSLGTDLERVHLAEGFFAPIELIQGAGGNVQIFRSRDVELDVRIGVGARQVIPRGARVLLTGDGPARLVPLPLEQLEGIETSAIGSARLSRWISLSTEFDSLYAFETDRSFIFSWRNQVNLRLASFASMSYRFNALQNEVLTLDSDIQTEHTVQLRFSYPLF